MMMMISPTQTNGGLPNYKKTPPTNSPIRNPFPGLALLGFQAAIARFKEASEFEDAAKAADDRTGRLSWRSWEVQAAFNIFW